MSNELNRKENFVSKRRNLVEAFSVKPICIKLRIIDALMLTLTTLQYSYDKANRRRIQAKALWTRRILRSNANRNAIVIKSSLSLRALFNDPTWTCVSPQWRSQTLTNAVLLQIFHRIKSILLVSQLRRRFLAIKNIFIVIIFLLRSVFGQTFSSQNDKLCCCDVWKERKHLLGKRKVEY